MSTSANSSSSPPPPVAVGVLGATGTVGQRFLLTLDTHPFFRLKAIAASPRSAGQKYADAAKWKQSSPIPPAYANLVLGSCDPAHFTGCSIIFSGLDADVAGDVELAFRAAEFAVFSNAKNHRRDPLVPLVVPLVNPDHFAVLSHQRRVLSLQRGFIVTNANCSTTGLVVPLAALARAFGPLDAVLVTTLQAASGAGYPGVASLDILDNVVPYISGEEEKMEWETQKITGSLAPAGDAFLPAAVRVSAACTRVPVIDGHTLLVSVRFATRPAPDPAAAARVLAAFASPASLAVPSAPRTAIAVHAEPDRPQPRLDRERERGAGVNVGRVRACGVLDLKFVVLVNNVALGAATSSIMNAEIALRDGFVGP